MHARASLVMHYYLEPSPFKAIHLGVFTRVAHFRLLHYKHVTFGPQVGSVGGPTTLRPHCGVGARLATPMGCLCYHLAWSQGGLMGGGDGRGGGWAAPPPPTWHMHDHCLLTHLWEKPVYQLIGVCTWGMMSWLE